MGTSPIYHMPFIIVFSWGGDVVIIGQKTLR